MGRITTKAWVDRIFHLFVLLLFLSSVDGQSIVGNNTSGATQTPVNPTPTNSPTTTNAPTLNTTIASNETVPNFGGLFNIISPETVWRQKTRFRLGSVVPIQWTYDKLVTKIPEQVGIVVAPLNTPDRHIVITTTQPGNQNYSWNTGDFKEELTEGWYILKIWDMRNGDTKKGPTTSPKEAGYVRPFVGNYNPFALYMGTTYVDDPSYCPTCINGAARGFPSLAWTVVVVLSAVVGAVI